ncbi:TPA: rubrerythrin family protein [Candidatus Thalassarchaeaceae archaeon]|nr:rubrerythrin family protein [Euryarchaeota archaeon]MDG1547362.1 VIT1/CCC1 transporter family protein [Candidatus Thalassarchaeaceae archaeon]DAC62852.1 MAG TPA: rubrerythrin family protein [Candidatus Poseidoniales archaeon]MBT3846602.1 rubrerythrin family protein [Euryarchaeota archaeon]MBT4156539.1 rubrerythrin family protein [Euryarchaeota archaeon]
MDSERKRSLIRLQRMEITEAEVYKKLAKNQRNKNNKTILEQIAEQEINHYNILKNITNIDVKPSRIRVLLHVLASLFFGLTFSLKLMEKIEQSAAKEYRQLGLNDIAKEEDEHEEKLLSLLEEDALNYLSSIILGLSDALVELTGALAGLTFAFQELRVVALAGLVTGIAASFSMAASEFLATKEENSERSPIKAAIFTGIAYMLTVMLLVTPYLLLDDTSAIMLGLEPHIQALCITLIIGLLIIALFNFYVSIAQDHSFKQRFTEMTSILIVVTGISFAIGLILREWFGI